jgi:hypothetical protein
MGPVNMKSPSDNRSTRTRATNGPVPSSGNLPPNAHLDLGTHTGGVRLRGGLCIPQHADDGTLCPAFHQRGQHTGGIAGGTSAGVVLRVADDDRLRGRSGDLAGLRHSLGGGHERIVQLGFGILKSADHLVGGSINGGLIGAIGKHRTPAVSHVGRREAEHEVHRRYAITGKARQHAIEPATGLAPGRLGLNGNDVVELPPGFGERRAAL